jgi:tetratricopeptide (TPR) repeat protein
MTVIRWQKWVVCLLLGAAALAVFWPALHCGFVYFDDLDYVTKNKDIQNGLTWTSFKWAWITTQAGNWHPITWLSHILDVELYGMKPASHHLTNLLLHAANSMLLFLLLYRLTGTLWRSAFVAAIFALHPLRVESVVWIAERKDVLSTFFWMLTVWAWIRYVENLKSRISSPKFFYGLSVVFYALGLMSKPMLVTLPFVLLLLDYWPLGRRAVAEKIPFFIMAACSCIVTYIVQHGVGAVQPLARFPVFVRLENVPIAYLQYIEKNFWPSGLAVFYPHHVLEAPQILGALLLLAVVTALAIRRRRAQPYLLVGWFWFLGMLVPTIGLVQVGNQAMADRYSYLSSSGLWIMVAWTVGDFIARHPPARIVALLAGAMALMGCIFLTPLQILYWHDSYTLFRRAVEVTDGNYLAYYNLGCYSKDMGDDALAIRYFQIALATESDRLIWADHSRAYNNLGFIYLRHGDIPGAVTNFEMALKIRPRYPEAYYNLGCAFLSNNQPDVALDCLRRAEALNPTVAEVYSKLGDTLARLGRKTEAAEQYTRARQLSLGRQTGNQGTN